MSDAELGNILRYVFQHINSNMYILMDKSTKSAIVWDPHISNSALKDLQRDKIQDILILLTHEHYDHTSGVNWLCEHFKCKLCCQKQAAESIEVEKNNRPLVVAKLLNDIEKTEELRKFLREQKPYKCKADITFEQEISMDWNQHQLHLVHTPGHSKGSCCIELDNKYVFTGDSLIPNISTITRFPGGDVNAYREKTVSYLKKIPKKCWIMPGHEEPILKEKLRNK